MGYTKIITNTTNNTYYIQQVDVKPDNATATLKTIAEIFSKSMDYQSPNAPDPYANNIKPHMYDLLKTTAKEITQRCYSKHPHWYSKIYIFFKFAYVNLKIDILANSYNNKVKAQIDLLPHASFKDKNGNIKTTLNNIQTAHNTSNKNFIKELDEALRANISGSEKMLFDLIPGLRQDIQKKSSHLWDCVDRKQTDAGYIYEFVSKKQFDCVTPLQLSEKNTTRENCNKKNLEIYPAIEKTAIELLFLDPNATEKFKIDDPLENAAKLFQQLGYACTRNNNHVSLFLPDRTHLLSQWGALQLGDLDIIESDGIATDREFTASFMHHDGILSTDKEFIHDHTIHLLPTIAKIFAVGMETYRSEKTVISGMIAEGYKKMDAIRAKMEANSLVISITPQYLLSRNETKMRCEIKTIKDNKPGFRINSKFMDEEKIWDLFEVSIGALVDGIASHSNHKSVLDSIERDGNDKSLKNHFKLMWVNPKSYWPAYFNKRFTFNGEILKCLWRYLNDPANLSPSQAR